MIDHVRGLDNNPSEFWQVIVRAFSPVTGLWDEERTYQLADEVAIALDEAGLIFSQEGFKFAVRKY